MTEIRPTLLVVDDDSGVVGVIERNARRLGFLVEYRGDRARLPVSFAEVKPDVALLDMGTHERGLAALREIRQIDPSCQVILMTRDATIDTAIEAVRSGASDYLAKPLDASRLRRALIAVHAMTERREHPQETRLGRLTRMRAAVSQINDAVVRMPARDELFQGVCQALVEHGGLRLATIGWQALDSRRLVQVAQSGGHCGDIRSIDIPADEGPEGHGPPGAAFRAGQPHVCNDLFAGATALPWRADMVRAGLHASALFPLRMWGQVRGALNLFAGEPGFFADQEIALLVDATAAVSFALDNIERDEQCRHAQGIARSEKLFSDTMIESLPGIVYIYDEQGRFLRWNHNFVTASGYSAEEIAQMHPLDFFSGDDKRRVQQRIADVFGSGHSTIEASLVGKDGCATPYFFTGRRVLVDGAAHLMGTGIDIADRRQAGDRLAESERKYREVVEHVNSIILRWSSEGRITFLNDFGQRFFGYSAEEILGRHVIGTIVPPLETSGRDLERLMERIRADPTAFERNVNENMRRNGERVWIAWTNRIGRDAQGEVVEILSVGADITEQKRAEGALRASEGRYRTLFEYAPDGIVIADRESRYIDVNTSMCRMLGYSRDELVGRHASDIVADGEIPNVPLALHTITTAAHYQREWRFRRQDGSIFPAEVIATVMPDGNLLAMIRDVSERRTLEAQYQQAQKMEAIGHLAGGVAHDFNNLLTAILGYCELLLTDFDPVDPRHADIGEIQKAGMRAAGLTRQLLAFSRKQIIEPTRLDLNVVVGDMQKMLCRLIGEDVEVVLRPGFPLALVQADRGQVEQIVMNLAVNARDAMPTGGTLTIETANVDLDGRDATMHFSVKPGSYVALTVSDTGTGMTPEVQAHLFEPFYTTKEAGKGTGLGLATIHGIVTQSSGCASVYSEMGKGTWFKVCLPRAETSGPVVQPPPPVAHPRGGGETVLVVEDAEELRELTTRLLERQGYKVLVASNAHEALVVFEQDSSIDVILTDVVMPGASGPELTSELINRRPLLKVIYMSGYSEDAIVHHGVLKPGIAFLHKPFTSATLGRKVREVLDR